MTKLPFLALVAALSFLPLTSALAQSAGYGAEDRCLLKIKETQDVLNKKEKPGHKGFSRARNFENSADAFITSCKDDPEGTIAMLDIFQDYILYKKMPAEALADKAQTEKNPPSFLAK